MAAQPGPWEDFQQAPVSAPAPTVRRGRPRLPPPQTGTQAEIDDVRLRNLELQNELDTFRRGQAARTAADPAGDSGVDQRKNAGFYLRASRAQGIYEQHAVAPRGVVGQTIADAFPRAANATADPARQMAEAAQRDWIAATLRYESGAAIPPSEFEQQARIYFPQPGDAPETIALKATLRQNAVEALRVSAGQAADAVEVGPQGNAPVLAPVVHDIGAMGLNAQAIAAGRPATAPTISSPSGPPEPGMGQVGTIPIVPNSDGGRNVVDPEGGPVLTDQDRRIASQATALANSRLSPDQAIAQINAIFRANGRQPLTAEAAESIRAARRNRSRHPGFSATPSGVSEGGSLLSRFGASDAGAFTINALDSASLGLPGLFSEDYREGLAGVRERAPGASIAGSLVGGVFAPGGPRPGMSLATQSLRAGGQGAVYGFNSSGGDVQSALVGGGIGGALPPAFRAVGSAGRSVRSAFGSAANYADDEAQAIARAGMEEGVPLSRPLLDPAARDRMAYLESQRGTGNAIRTPLAATRDAIEERASQIGGAGRVEEPGVMGQRVQEAGRRYIVNSRVQAGRMYDRATELAGDTRITPSRALETLDGHITELAEVPGGAPKALVDLRAQLSSENGFTVAGLRNLRTRLRDDFSSQGLTGSDIERRAMEVVDGLSDDINTGLTQAGRSEAALAYRNADAFYAGRQAEIQQVVQRVIGRSNDALSGEQVMARLRTMAGNRGDAVRLNRLWSKLSADEQLDAAATIAATAGRRTAEEGFEPGQFIAWARTLSPAARRTIFGPEASRSIENLRTLSRALMDTTQRLNNSRSGMVANWRSAFRDLVAGGPVGAGLGMLGGGSAIASGAAGVTIGAASTAGGMLFRRLSARALMNPDVSRWLLNAAQAQTPGAIRSQINRLQVVARSETNPAVAQEILGLRQALLNAVNDNSLMTGRVAASPGEGPDNRE